MTSGLDEAKRVLEVEAQAILDLKTRLNSDFVTALDILLNCKGKVVMTGMGKSGIIARKIASTFSSTGTPSVFMHPAESSHGDLGMISKDDVVFALSNSGESEELVNVIRFVVRKGVKLIAMTGKTQSTLGQAASVILNASVKEEACPLGLAPTASTTASLAMGDALAMALLVRRGFKPEDFAEYHPSGSLGSRLLTRVRDVMHTGEALALVNENDSMKNVIAKMTSNQVRGIACVVNSKGELLGAISDGDLRRKLDQNVNILTELAQNIMSKKPKTIFLDEMAEMALHKMESHSIQSLFVVDKSNPEVPVGVVHLHDLLKAKIR